MKKMINRIHLLNFPSQTHSNQVTKGRNLSKNIFIKNLVSTSNKSFAFEQTYRKLEADHRPKNSVLGKDFQWFAKLQIYQRSRKNTSENNTSEHTFSTLLSPKSELYCDPVKTEIDYKLKCLRETYPDSLQENHNAAII